MQPATVPAETPEEITGPIPIVGDESAEPTPAVTPQAPLDVRLLEAIDELFQSRPRWSERPPSMSETWKYSTTGDWTTDEKSAKRIPHGLVVLIAAILTYPLAWAVQVAREKPVGFVLIVAVLITLGKVL